MTKLQIPKYFCRGGLLLSLIGLQSAFLSACGDTSSTTATPAAMGLTATQSTTAPALATRPGQIVGQTTRLGAGLVQSWVKVDENNKAVAVGLTFSEAALTGLSPSSASQLPLSLPTEASSTAFNHLSVDWNPQGHEPPGIYDKPHFDIHFYLISEQERSAILASGDVAALTKSPANEAIPEGYILPPGPPRIVPGQGVHWFNSAAPEFRGQPFTQTFIYGFANAKLAFFEPMITKAYLESRPDFSSDLKLPGAYPKSGVSYPTRYSIKYDPANKEYLIALEGLTIR